MTVSNILTLTNITRTYTQGENSITLRVGL